MGNNGRGPQIKFGDEFNSWPPGKQIEYLKQLASSMNHAADMMQTERNEIRSKLIMAETKLAGAEKALQIQKDVVVRQLTDGNAEQQSMIVRMQALEAKVREQAEIIKTLRG